MKTQILTPVGRLVQGDCFEGQTKDAEGNPLVIKNGPNAGQPRVDYYMGLAIPKNDPEWPALHAEILAAAKAGFPTLFDPSGNCINPKFAFKITDGDSQIPNTKGKKPSEREGFPGHWVLSFSGGFAPKVYARGGESVITDPKDVKRGDYIRIAGSVAGNGSKQQPGVFLNHSLVEFIGHGEEIVTGPDAAAVFGAKPVTQLPAGASATPTAPPTTNAAMAPVQPHPCVMNPPVAPAPAAEANYNVEGTVYTHSQLLGFGWSEEQIALATKV